MGHAMTALGAALIFVGGYLMYSAYKAVHTHGAAAPVSAAKTALGG